ncbi:RNA polymerase sigma factor [Chelatococcus sambhunathii]|uniref:RNA polymerase sigma factor n=1 Tax=Chelatococcus sambhunathii TaxID=363953 RepID=A0ABU1DFC9_9HYPH|nr:RNA polymerase sigma factor [Chelatococcus sambhunathii]MDR4306822.1 RNA polymerase sigma factor [Chelatococcus sambhunathii]
MNGVSDEALVALAKAGDRRAFEALVSRHYAAIHRFSWRLCGEAAEAEDVAQETLIRVARGISGFEGRSAFRSWAFGVAANCAKDAIRARRRRARTLEAAAVAALVEPACAVEHDDGEAGLWDAVRDLPDGQREAVMLVHVEGLSHGEAARALGCAEATVSWRLFAARRRLKSHLSRASA